MVVVAVGGGSAGVAAAGTGGAVGRVREGGAGWGGGEGTAHVNMSGVAAPRSAADA